jgi:homoserine dehydrogenase
VRRVELVQLGLGYVGRAVAQIVIEERKRWREEWNLDLHYCAVADTSGALVGEELLPQAIRLKEEGGRLSELGVEPVEEILVSEPAPGTTRVVVDLAVHGGTLDLDLLGVRNGSYLVLSNKGPLSGSSAETEELLRLAGDRLWCEATVGAGMPIISTLDMLLGGRTFSEAVKEAVDLHYAEPDPRDDLSGLDVARKAIILARIMGKEIEPEEIAYESLVPEGLEEVPLNELMERLPGADAEFAERMNSVGENHMRRYLARIPKDGPVEVGLTEAAVESPFGPINGPENVFEFRTRRYSDVTLTVSGPGAGPHRTASGVVADLLDIVRKAVRDDSAKEV